MPRILRFQEAEDDRVQSPDNPPDSVEFVEVTGLAEVLRKLADGAAEGLLIETAVRQATCEQVNQLLNQIEVLHNLPDGVALINRDNSILFANPRIGEWFGKQEYVGLNFYQALGNPTIIGTELSPLTTSFARKTDCEATMLVNDNYYQLHVAPIVNENGQVDQLVVSLRDSTRQTSATSEAGSIAPSRNGIGGFAPRRNL